MTDDHERKEKHSLRLKRKRAIHKHLTQKLHKLRRLNNLQAVPKKFLQRIVKGGAKDDSSASKGKTKEFTSGKFFSNLQVRIGAARE